MADKDWTAIEGAYRLGVQSLRAIAEAHGITEGTIRARAKKQGWVRNAPATKRAIVAAHMAGVTQEVAQDVMRNLRVAADDDIADMQRGLNVQRLCLLALEQAAQTVAEPREVKVIVEATSLAIASIRNIRGLDEAANPKDTDSDDDARAESIAGRLESRIAETAA